VTSGSHPCGRRDYLGGRREPLRPACSAANGAGAPAGGAPPRRNGRHARSEEASTDVDAVAAAVAQQGAATAEISRNILQAASGTTQVAETITAVSRGAEETGAASGEVHVAAGRLADESNHLRLEVEKFLATVRPA
jgi:methyl-accepting chemotaxis protein